MIDEEGYRFNVAIVIVNAKGKLFWARRIHQRAWQFPQGGLNDGEDPLAALYRELHEEVGLHPEDVEVLAVSQGWFRYQLPEHMQRHSTGIVCIGQQQKWYLLKLIAPESRINLKATSSPEFDRWKWVDFWYPLSQVISFKRHVYRKALERFYPIVHPALSAQDKGASRREGESCHPAG